MRLFMKTYVGKNPKIQGSRPGSSWIAASLHAAELSGGKPGRSKKIRQWTRRFIADPTDIPKNPYGAWNHSRMADEALRAEFRPIFKKNTT